MEGNWIAALITVTVVAAYELRLAWGRRTRSIQISRHAHATLREEWFDAISASPGSEILAVLGWFDRGGTGGATKAGTTGAGGEVG